MPICHEEAQRARNWKRHRTHTVSHSWQRSSLHLGTPDLILAGGFLLGARNNTARCGRDWKHDPSHFYKRKGRGGQQWRCAKSGANWPAGLIDRSSPRLGRLGVRQFMIDGKPGEESAQRRRPICQDKTKTSPRQDKTHSKHHPLSSILSAGEREELAHTPRPIARGVDRVEKHATPSARCIFIACACTISLAILLPSITDNHTSHPNCI